MKITLFGANGAIGREFIDIALKNGEEINAFVRNSNTLNIEHDNLNIFVGDTKDKSKLYEAIEGQDVVVSTMGPSVKREKNDGNLPIKESHMKIIETMKELEVDRLITIGTTAIKAEEDKKQLITLIPPIIAKLAMPKGYAEVTGIGEVVRKSGLNWTIVRFLNPNVKSDGKGYDMTFGDKKGKFNVSRRNIAMAIYNAINKKEWYKKMPIIFNK